MALTTEQLDDFFTAIGDQENKFIQAIRSCTTAIILAANALVESDATDED